MVPKYKEIRCFGLRMCGLNSGWIFKSSSLNSETCVLLIGIRCSFPVHISVIKKTVGVDQGDSSMESPNTSIYKDKDASDPELNQYVDAPSSLPKVNI